jgi:diguanylate cyclase (GGDEF)-like protein
MEGDPSRRKSDGEPENRRPRGGPWRRFAAAALAGVAMELGNLGLGWLTPVPTLEPLPVVVFLVGVLLGWAGVAGCVAGQILYRLWLVDPLGWFRDSPAPSDQAFSQCVGIPVAYALIGLVGYLVFRLAPAVGRGFPNPRSYIALVVAGGAGGMLTALAINLQFSPTWKGFLVHSASNFVSVLLVCPPLLLLATRYLRPLMAEIPGEHRPPLPFPENLYLEHPGVDRAEELTPEARLAILGGVILAITAVVVTLAYRVPQVGGWPLIGYLGPVVWTAMAHGMRGGILATSLSGVLYLLGRSWVDRDLLPDDPDLYAVGLYADFVVFSLVGVFLGSEREEEIRLNHQLEERARQVIELNDMGDLLQASVNLEEAYEIVTHGLGKLFPHESGVLAMLKGSSQFLENVLFWGEAPPSGPSVFEPEDCWALRRGHVHFVEDPRRAPVCRHLAPGEETVSSYLCVPLMAQGETLGVLHLEHGAEAHDPHREGLTEAKRELAVTAGKEIALALGNLKLRESLRAQSIRDPLTGLFNRRYMAETLEREKYRALRQDLAFGVIMIDIDHFKRFNDRFGHEAGDLVLRELGKFLQTRARREDIVCRYGGEEFVIVLSEAALEITERRAEELRKEVKQLRLRHESQVLGELTMSFGVAAFPQHGATEKDVLRAADAALYRAKAAGRDRVMVAEVVG